MNIQSIRNAYGIQSPKPNQKPKKQEAKKTLEKVDVYEPTAVEPKYKIDAEYFDNEKFDAKWDKFINKYFS
jgi:hypothetical protein